MNEEQGLNIKIFNYISEGWREALLCCFLVFLELCTVLLQEIFTFFGYFGINCCYCIYLYILALNILLEK